MIPDTISWEEAWNFGVVVALCKFRILRHFENSNLNDLWTWLLIVVGGYSTGPTQHVNDIENSSMSWRLHDVILGLHPTNERRRYKVTPSHIGWAQT